MMTRADSALFGAGGGGVLGAGIDPNDMLMWRGLGGDALEPLAALAVKVCTVVSDLVRQGGSGK